MEIMTITLISLLTIIIGGVGIAYTVNKSKKMNDIFLALGTKYGLKVKHMGKVFSEPELTGRYKGLQIHVSFTYANKTTYLSLRAGFVKKMPLGFEISPENFGTGLKSLIGMNDDMQIGDKAFDDALLIESNDEQYLRAYLNTDMRDLITRVYNLSSEFKITSGGITSTKDFDMYSIKNDIETFINLCDSIEEELRRPATERDRLIDIILHDTSKITSRRCFDALVKSYPDDPETQKLLKTLLSSTDAWLRLEAAYLIGGTTAKKHILELLESPYSQVVKKAAHMTARVVTTEFINPLKDVYAAQGDKEIRKYVLAAFQNLADTGLSDFLLNILVHDSAGNQADVADALSTCGTLEAVEILLNLSKNPLNMGWNRNIKEAVAKIQLRLGKGDKGWVSLADNFDERGDLSITDEK